MLACVPVHLPKLSAGPKPFQHLTFGHVMVAFDQSPTLRLKPHRTRFKRHGQPAKGTPCMIPQPCTLNLEVLFQLCPAHSFLSGGASIQQRAGDDERLGLNSKATGREPPSEGW